MFGEFAIKTSGNFVPFLDSFVPTFAVTCLLIIMIIIIIIIIIIHVITWKVSFYF